MSFEVDLDDLRAAVTGLERLETTVEQKLAELERLMADLQRTWTGEAASAQKSAHDRWVAGAREMHMALGELRQAADHAHGGYTAAAQANAAMWRQVR